MAKFQIRYDLRAPVFGADTQQLYSVWYSVGVQKPKGAVTPGRSRRAQIMTSLAPLSVSLLIAIAASTAWAEIPVRTVLATGSPVPAATARPAVISLVDRPVIGPNGEVVFFAESSQSREFPAQFLLDLRGDTTSPSSERTFGPLLGAVRDGAIGDDTANTLESASPHFEPGGHLLTRAAARIPAGGAERNALILRDPSGLFTIAHASEVGDSNPLLGVANADGSVLLQATPLRFVHPGQAVVLNADTPVPDDVDARFLLAEGWLLDGDDVVVCCHQGAPYLWSDGVLANAAATPNETNQPTNRGFITAHRSGFSAFRDVYVDDVRGNVQAIYTGMIGSQATRVSDYFVDDGCPAGGSVTLEPVAMDGTGRLTVADSSCGIGQILPDGTLDWFVTRDDRDAGGATFSAFDQFAVFASDDGNSLLFQASATDPTLGDLEGAWLIPTVGADPERVVHIGQVLTLGVGDERTVSAVTLASGSVNNLGQGVVTVSFRDAENDVRAPSAILVANQPSDVFLADLELELTSGWVDVLGYLGLVVTLTNLGPSAVSEYSFTLELPDGVEAPSDEVDVPGICEDIPGGLSCADSTADPEGILTAGQSVVWRFSLRNYTFDRSSLDIRGTISSSLADPDLTNNTHLLNLPLEGIDLSVEEEIVNGGVLLTFYLRNADTRPHRTIQLRVALEDAEVDEVLLPESGCIVEGGYRIVCSVEELFPDEVVTFAFVVPDSLFGYDASASAETGGYDTVNGYVDVDDPSTVDGRQGGHRADGDTGDCSTAGGGGGSNPWLLLLTLTCLIARTRRGWWSSSVGTFSR